VGAPPARARDALVLRRARRDPQCRAELDNSAAVAQLITGWKATAEVYADPELRAALKRDSGEDYGPVPGWSEHVVISTATVD
jgi:hypothetical protein